MTDDRQYDGLTAEQWRRAQGLSFSGLGRALLQALTEIDRLTAEVLRLEGEVARQRAADAQSRIIPHGAPILGRRLVRQSDGACFYEHKPIGENVHART